MKTLSLFALTFALICISGCEITGPSMKVEPPKVKVSEPVKVESESKEKGKFCPPGQAKKGNC